LTVGDLVFIKDSRLSYFDLDRFEVTTLRVSEPFPVRPAPRPKIRLLDSRALTRQAEFGFAGYESVSVQYGKLAHGLCRELGVSPLGESGSARKLRLPRSSGK
jgi:hypothetical protein